MRLEEEIKTKGFRNEKHKLAVNLFFTSNWLASKTEGLFARFGVTPTQFNILRILRGQHPSPANLLLLKERMLDKQPDVSRLVDRLASKGLLERTVSAKDRRKLDIVISSSGLDLLARIDPELNAFEDGFGALNHDDVRKLNELLDQLRGR